jgi:hypothetical protein
MNVMYYHDYDHRTGELKRIVLSINDINNPVQ